MIAAAMVLAALPTTPVHPPDIEAHLAPIVGDWTRVGKEATYRDHCVWYDGHAFVVGQTANDSGRGKEHAELRIRRDRKDIASPRNPFSEMLRRHL